ncbi:MAG: hypothetical protein HKL95_05265 [Phycisphaerae bacterium]|nr:hypothetical protein [Phycisphaerae bacterium]
MLLLAGGLAACGTPGSGRAATNNSMFPPPPAVAKSITIDGRGFIIHGCPTFIASGSLHYARVPRALWANRLLRMKRAGFNAVSTYVFWNYQEPQEGIFRFNNRRSLIAFLALVQKMGMYAILRIGPYNNGEWANGGLPNWLRFIPNMMVRTYNPLFLHALKPYFDRLLPMVAAYQVTHRILVSNSDSVVQAMLAAAHVTQPGPVIMVQIENEYGPGWGAVLNNRYLRWLHAMAIKNGIDVPFFFSGLDQGFGPVGNAPFSAVGRTAPWFTTELWSGWFDEYGESALRFLFWWKVKSKPASLIKTPSGATVNSQFERLHTLAAWRVLALGGRGYNVYMTVGGSNFSHWNGASVRSSYDFGSPIGQAGDLRAMYYRYKRVNYFARTFAQILETATNGTWQYRSFARAITGHIQIYARKSPFGSIVFILNPHRYPAIAQIAGGGPRLKISPGCAVPVVLHVRWGSWLTLSEVCGAVLGGQTAANTKTLVIYGPAGSQGLVRLRVAAGVKILRRSHAISPVSSQTGQYVAHLRFPAHRPRRLVLCSQFGTIRIICENSAMADATWFMRQGKVPVVVVGPWYVSHFQVAANGQPDIVTEAGFNVAAPDAYVFYPQGAVRKFTARQRLPALETLPAAPALGRWQRRLADGPAQPDYPTADWRTVWRPHQIGYRNYLGDYQWYRATYHAPVTGVFTLVMPPIGGTAAFFVNGRPCGYGRPRQLPVPLHRGTNTLAILAMTHGRSKIFSFIGKFQYLDFKGFYEPVHFIGPRRTVLQPPHSRVSVPIKTWPVRTCAALPRPGSPLPLPEHGLIAPWKIRGGIGSPNAAKGWRDFTVPPHVPCFYRTTFNWPLEVGRNHLTLRARWGHLQAGYIWLNGHNLGRYPDFNMPMGIYLPPCWLKPGRNTLVILDEQGRSPLACKLAVEPAASRRVVKLYVDR